MEEEGPGGRDALRDGGGKEQREQRHGDKVPNGDGDGHEGAVEAVHHAAEHARDGVAQRGADAEEDEEGRGLSQSGIREPTASWEKCFSLARMS